MDREYRQYSLLLFREYFAQTNVDLFIDTTANATVGKILTAFGANEIPQFPSEHRRWIVRYSDTIENALRRRRIPAAALWKHPLGWVCLLWDRAGERSQVGRSPRPVRALDKFDERFDAVWSTLRNQPNHLLAVRNCAALSWHFGNALRRGASTILVLEEQGDVTGYAVCLWPGVAGIPRGELWVGDLQSIRGDPEDIESLMSGVLRLARRGGATAVRARGINGRKRRMWRTLDSSRDRVPWCPGFYKARSQELHALVGTAGSWGFSLYDGDAVLI